LAFDDTGTFDIDLSTRTIRWYRGTDSNSVAVRTDLLGRVLALAVHREGALVLHASAVSVEDGVVAFLGPKGAGKSTLAMALVRHGGRLVTDDTLVVRFEGDATLASPGVQRVRLWADSASAIGAAVASTTGAKPMIDDLAPGSREHVARPLVACYVLNPVADDQGFVRQQLGEVHAAIATVGCSKLGALAGGRLAVEVLERSTRLAQVVPVYAANVPRDLNALDLVASTIMSWQAAPAPNVPRSR
jgi:ABC-type cobalamin/Fe3+-siderophores transport system ATPase subunit